jgi:serine/threonine-protein phosphatase 2A regulatory subunit A
MDVEMNDNNNINNAVNDLEKEIASLDPVGKVSLLIDELRNSNFNVRLFCVKNLINVSELLGPERTEEELLPLIIDHIVNCEDNEEVLIEISNQLYNLINNIANKSNIASILRGLELLAGNDDEQVRQQATENLCKLIKLLDERLITNDIFPLMQRLIQNDMKSKVSCCYLFPIVYPKLNDENIKKELIQAYFEISRDDSPSVRRAAASNIKHFALIDDPDLIKDLVNLFNDLLKDNVDIVKVYTIESTKNLLLRLKPETQQQHVFNFTNVLNKDRSWRVKYAAAECICDICSFFDNSFNEQNFLPLLLMFLKDPEPEVRSAVISKLFNFIPHISIQKFSTTFLPIFQDSISSDINHHVRALFASSLLKCCKYFDEGIFETKIYPIINKLLRDDVFEVKCSTLNNLGELSVFFKNERIMLTYILPLITDLSKDTKWRSRLIIAEKLSLLFDLSPRDQFISYFLPLLNNFFLDHANQIREVTFQIYEKICKTDPNSNFINSNLWELQKNALNSANYIIRISTLNSIDYLKGYYKSEFLSDVVLMNLFDKAGDKVANVNFCLCNILKSIIQWMSINHRANNSKVFSTVVSKSIVLLKIFEKDSDVDVRYFAKEALNVIENIRCEN